MAFRVSIVAFRVSIVVFRVSFVVFRVSFVAFYRVSFVATPCFNRGQAVVKGLTTFNSSLCDKKGSRRGIYYYHINLSGYLCWEGSELPSEQSRAPG